MQQFLENAIEQMPAGLTILDPQGRILYYNQYAESIVDRKPDYIGRDVRDFHIPSSNQKIDRILAEYARGSNEVHTWQLDTGGMLRQIRVAPLYADGAYQGLIHLVMPITPPENT
jgi:PAS domain S-box-containing protein